MKIAPKLALLAVLASYALVLRPRMLNAGATEEEVSGDYPGEELVPGGRRHSTMAITIDAPPSAIWPWLAQMGCNRAGWYSWDRLDNGGHPSATVLHPEWQGTSAGDRLISSPGGKTWFDVAAADEPRFLALRVSVDSRGHHFDPAGQRPRSFLDSLWCFHLCELPGERTRLIVSGYVATSPLQRALGLLFWEPAHWFMQRKQLANLKRLAEAAE